MSIASYENLFLFETSRIMQIICAQSVHNKHKFTRSSGRTYGLRAPNKDDYKILTWFGSHKTKENIC